MSTLTRFDSTSSGLSQALCQFVQFKVNGQTPKEFPRYLDLPSYTFMIGNELNNFLTALRAIVKSDDQIYKYTKWRIGQHALERHIRKSLAGMIYGSKRIEGAAFDFAVTESLCDRVFTGHSRALRAGLDETDPAAKEILKLCNTQKQLSTL